MLAATDFIYDSDYEVYRTVYNNFEIEIDKIYMNEVTVKLAEQVVGSYSDKLAQIARFCIESENFQHAYPQTTYADLIVKLGAPDLTIHDAGGVLSYCEHEFDYEHIIDIEFAGVLAKFTHLSING